MIGFIIFGIVVDCGGTKKTAVNPDYKSYLGARYWHDPGAFHNGFNGFCGVFVTAAFAFAGTELVGLAAAKSADPRKSIPLSTKQVFWRVLFFYLVNLFIVGPIVKSDDDRLLNASGANTKASPFVFAIQDAGVKGYLAAPIVIALFIGWKMYSHDWRLYVPLLEMDLKWGARLLTPEEIAVAPKRTWKTLPYRLARSLF